MQRSPREPSALRRFLGLLTLVVLPQVSPDAQLSCGPPEQIVNGYMEPRKDTYEKDAVIKYYCNFGFKLIGKSVLICMANEQSTSWDGSAPECQIVRCENPVVEHGILLSGFNHMYTFGKVVTFECAIGYFMVGSYLIRCNEDNVWNPEVPSCRKIAPDLCGAPLIPSGRVRPLHPQYSTGSKVKVLCNPQQCFPDETIEMSTECQGYNFWKPPIRPCFLRTSPDTSKLKICNGKIIGRKKNYIPGDNVTIQCYAGYTLQGSSTIRYIGGQKWLPEIPSCSLNFFFVLLILAIIFIILLLPVKMLCNKCFSR